MATKRDADRIAHQILRQTMRFISSDELRAKGVTISRATLWRLIKKGEFPKPIKTSKSRNAWVESEIDAWMRSRIEARDRGVA